MPSVLRDIRMLTVQPTRTVATGLCVSLVLVHLAVTAAAQPPNATPEAASQPDADAPQSEESAEAPEASPAQPERLLDREPFDRITLNAENGHAQIETVLLDLPNRTVPDPFPTEGLLDIRRLRHPSIPYEVDWTSIEKIELYEQMLLQEAERLTATKEFAEAFDYYAFLSANYPNLAGLETAQQSHLWQEASAAYADGRKDDAWPILHALYLRNPAYPRLASAIQAVSDDMIKQRIAQRNFPAARAIIEALEATFPKLSLPNIERWRAQFEADARAQLQVARTAFAAQEYSDARSAIAHARAIWPAIQGGDELWKEIQETALEIRVGVFQHALPAPASQTRTWPAARVSRLVDPCLIEMEAFGAEGGVYASRWCELSTSDDGLETTLRILPAAVAVGISPDIVALRLAEAGLPGGPEEQADFASLVDTIRIADGRDVVIRWRRPHVRPEALLQLPLRSLVGLTEGKSLWFEALEEKQPAREQRYERPNRASVAQGEPRFVVEQIYDNDEQALEALARGDIDVLDRVPPWQLERVGQSPDIAIAPYRMPTVHVLIPHFRSALMELREFRRALEYGIDSESIVQDLLLGGSSRSGFRTVSGPFPAGSTVGDPVGYAYNPAVPTRPYEPRLAALLAGVARETLAKREAQAARTKAAASSLATAGSISTAGSTETLTSDAAPRSTATTEMAPNVGSEAAENNLEDIDQAPSPVVLAHPADPMSTLACQSIKIQLDTVGIPVKLRAFSGSTPPADGKYDLLYAELAVFEPVFEARRTLGRGGVASRTSPLMALALDELAASENWNDAREVLHEIHRIAHYDLPLIPLWQTVNYFAYRKAVTGLGENPVSLYQNLPSWRKAFE
jgi:hypothetical protein